MLAVFNPFVDFAYHLVSVLAAGLAALPAGLAAAAAIVAFTMAVRLAPQIQELRQRHARQPDRLRTEITALYQREGTGVLSGCLPVLLQAPFLSVMYLLFRSPIVDGKPNGLLTHNLFGAPLGSHWLGGAGPLSTQGAVFAGIFVLLTLIGWLHARTLGSAMQPPAAGTPAAGTGRQPIAQPGGAFAVLTRLAPYFTVVMAAFVPLAAGLYLMTTTAWTLGERTVLRRRMHGQAPTPPADRPPVERR